MDKIQVKVLNNVENPGATMAFLARLTQRGHSIKNMDDLVELYNKEASPLLLKSMADLPHGTIKRFTPITVAIVGASRRFLAQARTNQVGFNYVSASLQYSDYSDKADFVVPYALMARDHDTPGSKLVSYYLNSCAAAMHDYKLLAKQTDNDTAGYVAPQGLRNILIMQGNHQSWDYFIRTRMCRRNTEETRYVTALIWQELLKTSDGWCFFSNSGPDCLSIGCREGKMSCGKPMNGIKTMQTAPPESIIKCEWPLLYRKG